VATEKISKEASPVISEDELGICGFPITGILC